MLIIAIILGIIVIMMLYSYITVSNGPINPLGRLSFVKIDNPDMYPGLPHSELLAEDASERGSACALIVHFSDSSNYHSYAQSVNNSSNDRNSVYIIEVSYIDTQANNSENTSKLNLFDSFKMDLFGISDGRYKYFSDGIVYNSYDELMNHVNTVAKSHGQNGPIPMVWYGGVSNDNPIIDQGSGFPLYFQILTRTYGVIPAYFYTIKGLIFPYIDSPYRNYELFNTLKLQKSYDTNEF